MNFSEYFRLAHSEGKQPSGKRFWGGVIVGCAQIILMTATILSFASGHGITNVLENMWDLDIIVGSTLLGLNTVSKMFGNHKISASNEPEKCEE